jgi:hypothetical protein
MSGKTVGITSPKPRKQKVRAVKPEPNGKSIGATGKALHTIGLKPGRRRS